MLKMINWGWAVCLWNPITLFELPLSVYQFPEYSNFDKNTSWKAILDIAKNNDNHIKTHEYPVSRLFLSSSTEYYSTEKKIEKSVVHSAARAFHTRSHAELAVTLSLNAHEKKKIQKFCLGVHQIATPQGLLLLAISYFVWSSKV